MANDYDHLETMLTRIDERTERMERDIGDLVHVVLTGNGSPPLTAQVARMDERVDAIENSVTARWGFRTALIAGILTLAGIAVRVFV